MDERHTKQLDGRSGAGLNSWCCELCGLKSAQLDEASYLRHVDFIHHDLVEDKKGNLPEAEYHAWRRHIIAQAFSPSPADSTQPARLLPLRTLVESGKAPSFGSAGVDIQGLSIGAGHDSQADSMVAVPGSRIGPGNPAASDEALGLAPDSWQSPSARPLRPSGNRQSPGARASPRALRPQPQPQEADGFSRFTSQSRPQSREQHPADEELRRKGPIANTQPSTPPGPSPRHHARPPRQRGVVDLPPDPRYPNMILQPDNRGISQEQLATEVRTIYSGLSNIESRCIKLVKDQSGAAETSALPANIWRGLISLHRALLNDHHDFFLASQHPSAAPALHRLAVKYNMPARMWKHGIHSFLELLRHQLPNSLEYMISFIYLAYQMMSLLLETVPSFEDTWIECLGDLSRYRMAVEEEDPKDRETWCNVAKYWYLKAADRMPNVGRLYHHLAILARPHALQQVYLYSRSLIAVQPFLSARESIQTVFDPLLKNSEQQTLPEVDAAFIQTTACIFYRKFDQIEKPRQRFLDLLDGQIGRVTSNWRQYGVYIGGTTIGALMDFGNKSTMLSVFETGNFMVEQSSITKLPDPDEKMLGVKSLFQPDAESEKSYQIAADFFFSTFSLVLERPLDKNTHPYLHITFAFILALSQFHSHSATSPELAEYITRFTHRIPWAEIAQFLTMLAKTENFDRRFESIEFLRPEDGDGGPLPEDYLLRGPIYTKNYFPSNFFVNTELDDERLLEVASTTRKRGERLLWIGYKLAQTGCFSYETMSKTWTANTDSPIVSEQILVLGSDHITTTSSPSQPMEGIEPTLVVDDSAGSPSVVSAPGFSFAKIEVLENVGQWTDIVIDFQIIVNGDVFEGLVRSRFSVLIPTPIWKKVKIVAKQLGDPGSKEADAALDRVRKAVNDKENVKIIDQTNVDVTQREIDSSLVSPSEPATTGQLEQDEETIIDITRKASDLKKRSAVYTEALAAHPKAQAAALLSDNSSIQLKARHAGLVVLASARFRSLIKSRSSASDADSSSKPYVTGRVETI